MTELPAWIQAKRKLGGLPGVHTPVCIAVQTSVGIAIDEAFIGDDNKWHARRGGFNMLKSYKVLAWMPLFTPTFRRDK